jgi:hypothetical protein
VVRVGGGIVLLLVTTDARHSSSSVYPVDVTGGTNGRHMRPRQREPR